MSANDDLKLALSDARMLARHGLDGWPSINGLTRKVCDVQDELDALASALGVELKQDFRGRWRVVRETKGVN